MVWFCEELQKSTQLSNLQLFKSDLCKQISLSKLQKQKRKNSIVCYPADKRNDQ